MRGTQQQTTHLARRCLRVMSYNVHSCRGSDGRLRPERVVSVIRNTEPDVAALQELSSLSAAQYLADELHMDLFFVAARTHGDISYGNGILSRFSGMLMQDGPLPQLHPRLETRAAQWIRFATEWGDIDVINAHLGLDPKERLLQVDELLGTKWLTRPDMGPNVLLCGDLNARPGSAPYARLCTKLKDIQNGLPRRLSTFPALFPIIRIDHVMTSPSFNIDRVSVPSDILARWASDHRPLVADLSLEARASS